MSSCGPLRADGVCWNCRVTHSSFAHPRSITSTSESHRGIAHKFNSTKEAFRPLWVRLLFSPQLLFFQIWRPAPALRIQLFRVCLPTGTSAGCSGRCDSEDEASRLADRPAFVCRRSRSNDDAVCSSNPQGEQCNTVPDTVDDIVADIAQEETEEGA